MPEYRKITPELLEQLRKEREAEAFRNDAARLMSIDAVRTRKEPKKAQHTFTPKQWKHRKIHMKMAKQSRGRNMK